jgi:hypothetical protein
MEMEGKGAPVTLVLWVDVELDAELDLQGLLDPYTTYEVGK